jgi:hypothetical protein
MKIAWLLGRKSLKSDYCGLDWRMSVGGSAVAETLSPARSDFPSSLLYQLGSTDAGLCQLFDISS